MSYLQAVCGSGDLRGMISRSLSREADGIARYVLKP